MLFIANKTNRLGDPLHMECLSQRGYTEWRKPVGVWHDSAEITLNSG